MSNHEDRHPSQYKAGHPVREIMRAVCGLPGPYDPEDPELLQIRYDELLAILEDKIGSFAPDIQPSSGFLERIVERCAPKLTK